MTDWTKRGQIRERYFDSATGCYDVGKMLDDLVEHHALRAKIEALEIWQGDDGRASLVSLSAVLALFDDLPNKRQPTSDRTSP